MTAVPPDGLDETAETFTWEGAREDDGTLATYYGSTPTNPDPTVQRHQSCGGMVITFKDGQLCVKCRADADWPDAN